MDAWPGSRSEMQVRSLWQAVVLSGILFATGAAHAGVNRWTESGPPPDCGAATSYPCSAVAAMAMDPFDEQVLYAVQSGFVRDELNSPYVVAQLWRSGDGGVTWVRARAGSTFELSEDPVVAMHVATSGAIYILGDETLQRSADGGVTWSSSLLPEAYNDNIDLVVQDGAVFVAKRPWCIKPGCGGGIFRSTDDGRSWKKVGLEERRLNGLSAAPDGTLYAYGEALHQSGDQGRSWKDVTPRDSSGAKTIVTGVVVDPVTGTLFASFAANSYSAFARSLDSGRTWRELRSDNATSGFRQAAAADPSHGGHFLSATVWGGVMRTTDGGERWTHLNDGLTIYGTVQLLIAPSGTTFHAIFAGGGSDGRLFHYTVVPPRRRAAAP